MVLKYIGVKRSQAELAEQMHAIPGAGIVGRHILNLQTSDIHVVYAQGAIEHLATWLAKEIPIIVFVQTAELPYWHGAEAQHAVVVVGLDQEHVYVLDPAQEPNVIAVAVGDMALAWEDWMDGRFAVITRHA